MNTSGFCSAPEFLDTSQELRGDFFAKFGFVGPPKKGDCGAGTPGLLVGRLDFGVSFQTYPSRFCEAELPMRYFSQSILRLAL